MNIGDIFVVEQEPSPENDVNDGEYPVYGVVLYVDDDDSIETSVFSPRGKLIQNFWYFYPDEVVVLEEA